MYHTDFRDPMTFHVGLGVNICVSVTTTIVCIAMKRSTRIYIFTSGCIVITLVILSAPQRES